MVVAFLLIVGLSLGSFVNALVWRVYMQSRGKPSNSQKVGKKTIDLSISKGRSVCVHCGHELGWYDLIPVLSWLSLRGRCRYCKRGISWQYPVVEVCTAALFVLSYTFWPKEIGVFGLRDWIEFSTWLITLVGFMALLVYDIKWMLLPNRIVYPLIVLAAVSASVMLLLEPSMAGFYNLTLSIIVAGGLFFLLFQVSDGKWIGGGDVKLGILAGLLLADPFAAFLMLFLASILGTLTVLPALVSKRLKASSHIPFGPFLIIATIIVKLFGASVIEWYKHTLMLY